MQPAPLPDSRTSPPRCSRASLLSPCCKQLREIVNDTRLTYRHWSLSFACTVSGTGQPLHARRAHAGHSSLRISGCHASFIRDFALKEVIERSPNGGDGGQPAYFVPAWLHSRAQ